MYETDTSDSLAAVCLRLAHNRARLSYVWGIPASIINNKFWPSRFIDKVGRVKKNILFCPKIILVRLLDDKSEKKKSKNYLYAQLVKFGRALFFSVVLVDLHLFCQPFHPFKPLRLKTSFAHLMSSLMSSSRRSGWDRVDCKKLWNVLW